MTLKTKILLTGPIHGREVFELAVSAILKAGDCRTPRSNIVVQNRDAGEVPEWAKEFAHSEFWVNDFDQVQTKPAQGLPATVRVNFREDGSPLATVDVREDDYVCQHACTVQVSYETGYGYRTPEGKGPASLHAMAMVELCRSLPNGVNFAWVNEYDDTLHEGVNAADLLDFLHYGR